jgi:hypothetical protein
MKTYDEIIGYEKFEKDIKLLDIAGNKELGARIDVKSWQSV